MDELAERNGRSDNNHAHDGLRPTCSSHMDMGRRRGPRLAPMSAPVAQHIHTLHHVNMCFFALRFSLLSLSFW